MKRLIVALALLFAVAPGFAQEYEQKANDAFAKLLYPYFDEIGVLYTKGFSTSIHLSFYTFGTMKTLDVKCPREVTAQAAISENDFSAAKKGSAAIRKLLLEAAKESKNIAAIYVGRMFSGVSPMIFRVVSKTNKDHYYDIALKDEEVFGVPFDQVDKKQIVRVLMDLLNEENKLKPSLPLRMSDDGNWLMYSYRRKDSRYRQGEAFDLAQSLGAELFNAFNMGYYERSKPYYYLIAPFGMGLMVEVVNQDSHEVSREWIYPEEVREFCLEEGHRYHGPYVNTWFLTLPDGAGATAREYSDAVALELWCRWYDLLGGEWTVDRIMSMIRQSAQAPDSPMKEVIGRCKSSGKPLHVVLNSRFGIRFSGEVSVGEL